MFCSENKYRIDESGREELVAYFKRLLAAKGRNFSNGRLVRKIFERTRLKQALRASNSIITGEDIKKVFAESDIAELLNGSIKTQIGFMMTA